MKDKPTEELIQRLKRIEIEKWNLGIEATQIIEELWRRIDNPNIEKTEVLVKKERNK